METITKKVLTKSENPVRRLLTFKEWCAMVYEPSKRMREEYSLRENKDHGVLNPVSGV